ncbi:hypothetical protein V1L54_21785 [Streptomyces sp. TRM 70361]|uniref:hypothetical protein n=1 Tax=Streptomyces sp. TRM 70361 TaxID=3116553 RepID=UPI002E7BF1D6|nr:hypothetical protein [Streptomyces sp. TRM 70361]MEE1941997.1 hypothetical protein [Streptomyces sp. TRM 70361]
MWPGQQPGGEQNPHDPRNQQGPQQPNPYRTPGYQAPNPYQAPGYQAPNPYQAQPGGPWGQPGGPGAPQPPRGGGKGGRTAAIAVVVAVAVIAAAVVTGVLVLRDDGGEKTAKGGDRAASPSAEPSTGDSAAPSEEPEKREDDPSNPRDGLAPEKPDPVVPGWQVVTNAKHHSAFDVPPDWKVRSEDTIIGYGQKDKDDPFSGPLVAFSAPAVYKEGWCTSGNSEYTRSVVGSKGGQGSRDTVEGAELAAENFVYSAYGEQKDTVRLTKAKPFSNAHGIKGHIASATATGVKKGNKCDSDGKAVALSWIDGTNDLRIWVLVSDAGVEDEVPQAVIDKMTASLRPYAEEE